MGEKEVILSLEGLKRLEQELEHLKSVKRREVADRIKQAREFGDIGENSEYDDAKNEQAWVESRIAEISEILAHATLISSPKKNDRVHMGSKVELTDGSGTKRVYHLVGSAEADPDQNKISNESPVGQAVMGKKKGDPVVVPTPSGKKLEFTVTKISH